jgi:heterodisulfide reductase subunit A
MFATKEAVLAKEHYGDIHAYIFYTDMKAVGKGFEEFISRAKQEYGIDYIRARVGFISEDKKTKQLTIWYEDGKRGKATRLTVDLVVLATALLPRSELAKILHIETDESGFIRAKDEVSAPVQTSQERVFVAGYCQSPKDIPESVAQGSAAAAKVAEVIA